MAEIIPPESWRVIGDMPGPDIFIPTDGSERSRRVYEAVEQMSSAEAAEIAAGYLAAHDSWSDPVNHPAAIDGRDEPAINEMTLRQLVDWAEANDHKLEDVMVDYADCGTHRVVMYVRTSSA